MANGDRRREQCIADWRRRAGTRPLSSFSEESLMIWPTLVIALGLSAIPEPPKAGMLDDAIALQGTWGYATLELDGKAIPEQAIGGSKLEIAGNKFTSTTGDVVYKGTFKLDTAQKPKTIDLTFTEGPEKGNTALGIYELNGDTWRICLTVTAKERPKEFATKSGSGLALETLKRKKAGDPADAIKAELAKFVGEWSMVSGEIDGQSVPDAMRGQFKRVATGDETLVTLGESVFMRAKFTVDPAKKPKTIDYTLLEGPNKGAKQLGIYEFDGDNLKFCFAQPGKERPTDFKSPAGSGRVASVWKKAKK
jgi:uncharacterized protein (TIGR03067 family)